MLDWDTRTRQAIDKADRNWYQVFGWHNLSCVCDDCLEADAMVALVGGTTRRTNFSGLT